MTREWWTTPEHRQEVCKLAQQAQEELAEGQVAAAHATLDLAFELVEQHGVARDVVFLAVLLTAGDAGVAIDDLDGAASFYRRVTDEGTAMDDGEPGDLADILGRAWLGLARCDVARGPGYVERAPERYALAQRYVARSETQVPEAIREELRRGVAGL